MHWNVEVTDEFGRWYIDLIETVQDDIDRVVGLLEAKGAQLPFPHSSGIEGSRHTHMRELRVQSAGEPWRIFYAFDPRRTAILLIGGNKVGDDRFYETIIPIADRLYDDYLIEIRREGLI
ncbi:type II toxin-antitoxin system RelE/ParE family toxin [Phreatobacter sp. AB_2022a]|uniref:type II toxin-antitoxin system RelE/ParE family toxin n=1 Tax=Phreatobacter sp. AB_2022a TaxID=3003134 RepID=UPI002286F880|nr:type II toxin-antitoxin system RelE/ParE family toxin [Phreatobacter sp. AB_2022a]MCZ0738657.1 type II toxin-antitoxin system RelE/ParE family toxin [Phreatobacter sp. AB_2022a]